MDSERASNQEPSPVEECVTSNDATLIAYRTVGRGPAVIVIPGALTTADELDGFAKAMATRFTVHTVERRGRGKSGAQGHDYGVAKEVEDICALQEKTGASLLFGHSFGGFVALEAALKSPAFKRVAVYEPGVSIGGSIRMDWAPRCTGELSEGRPLDAFVTFIRGINPETSGRAPRWFLKFLLPIVMGKPNLAKKYPLMAGTIREHAEAARLNDTHERYKGIPARVLLMSGKDVRTVKRLAPVLNAEVALFPKLDHFGPERAPAAVAERILPFFS
jgi:pimeloyl-ACP methyl ester carboxylesterase